MAKSYHSHKVNIKAQERKWVLAWGSVRAICCSAPSLDNSLVISLWESPSVHVVRLRLTVPPTTLTRSGGDSGG